MARSISSSISTLRSSLSDIRTAFSNVNVSVPSSLKVSQVDDYIKQIDAKFPSTDVGITGPNFNSLIKEKVDVTRIEKIIFVPYWIFNYGSDGNEMDLGNMHTYRATSVLYVGWDLGYANMDSWRYRYKLQSGYKMFSGFTNLKFIDLSQVDFSNVSDCDSMFNGCTNLEVVNFTGCNLQNVTDMRNMFNGCTNLESVLFDPKVIIKPKYLQYMFNDCLNLRSVILPFNPASVTDITSMFEDCVRLDTIAVNSDYSDWTTNSSIKNGSNVFLNCKYLNHYTSGDCSGAYAKKATAGNFYCY